MGFFWDLIQQGQLSRQEHRAETLEARVAQLETMLDDTNRILRRLLERLEIQLGEDIDRDGRVG